MIWTRLKNLLCPSCNARISLNPMYKVYSCTKKTCEFVITKDRFNSLVESLYTGKSFVPPEDNQEALNNL